MHLQGVHSLTMYRADSEALRGKCRSIKTRLVDVGMCVLVDMMWLCCALQAHSRCFIYEALYHGNTGIRTVTGLIHYPLFHHESKNRRMVLENVKEGNADSMCYLVVI